MTIAKCFNGFIVMEGKLWFILLSFCFLFGISAQKEGEPTEDVLKELTEMLGLSC